MARNERPLRVDLIRSPRRRSMTGICAFRPAGLDVKESPRQVRRDPYFIPDTGHYLKHLMQMCAHGVPRGLPPSTVDRVKGSSCGTLSVAAQFSLRRTRSDRRAKTGACCSCHRRSTTAVSAALPVARAMARWNPRSAACQGRPASWSPRRPCRRPQPLSRRDRPEVEPEAASAAISPSISMRAFRMSPRTLARVDRLSLLLPASPR